MKNRQDVVEQLEWVLSEIKQARSETASSTAVGTQPRMNRGISFVHPITKLIFKLIGWKILLALILVVALSAGSAWFLLGSSFTQDSATVVGRVQELAKLATAEAYMKTIIEQEDNKIFGQDIRFDFPGTKRRVLVVIPATVIAGVNLKEISANNIKVNEDLKEISIVLPHADFIQEPSIQMEKVETFSYEGFFRSEVNWEEGFYLAAEAQKQIKEEAIEIGLLKTAELNTEKVISELFGNLGYSVQVTFS
jgi:hypothetical protein